MEVSEAVLIQKWRSRSAPGGGGQGLNWLLLYQFTYTVVYIVASSDKVMI